VDGPVDPAAAEQAAVGRVDDGVYLQSRNVASKQGDLVVYAAVDGRVRTCRTWVKEKKEQNETDLALNDFVQEC
jgi:hypothetical protein